ncbi:uncharacterized protein LOC124369186 isoform X1 [Homalodisca vitripennis]|uniref:uncharacterized protein LOC124369186 isoform X1 n=1 Tax=Homalodisca vitripennis TaxID=197043 RepID=UPI001EEAEA6C|nr:uncharacterized protein LOC124369186 isoform X1 [Homalodisca vitripennis]XP_046682955.1 uncharacterized protein LOC124369186 isoform X1 [Homalodisca vitripennis]KAG8335513.1 hypothetical protein J6590_066423 [Homalodisca vitripennis]
METLQHLKMSDIRGLIDEKLSNMVTKAELGNVKTEITGLQDKNVTLKQEVNSLKKRVLSLESNSRRNNLIFKGLKITSQNDYVEAVITFCCEMFSMSNKLWVNRAYPITKNKSLILAQFPDDEDVREILSKRFQLKGTEYAVFQDLPPDVRYKRGRLFAVRAEVDRISGKTGTNIIAYDHLIVDKCRFTWEDEKLICEGMDGVEKLNRLFKHDFRPFITRLAENGPPIRRPIRHQSEPIIQPRTAASTPNKSGEQSVMGSR